MENLANNCGKVATGSLVFALVQKIENELFRLTQYFCPLEFATAVIFSTNLNEIQAKLGARDI